ncbi:MAG: serine hydrolase [Bacteroidia bacterium]
MRTVLLVILLSILAKVHGQVQVITKDSKEYVIDSLLKSCHNKDLFNGVALVVDEGKIILNKTYGISDFENQTPLKLSDRFYIGSITKQFTSVLILQMQEDGLIDINAPIANYLDEFGDKTFAQITVYQLLTHTSGLGNFTSHPDFDKSMAYSEQEMFDFIKQPLLFPPGSDWNYSNSGYFLLGKIAERVSHKDYGTLLRERFFDPLEMKNTAFSIEWLNDKVAHGYLRTIDGLKPMPNYSTSSLYSSGGIFSTASDLFVWSKALDGNKLLNEKSKEVLLQPERNDYACGIYVKKGIDENGGEYERHFHGGMIQGYHSFMLKRVPQKQVVILLDNFNNQEIPTIKNRIWSALIEEEIKEIKPKLSNLLFDACAKNTFVKLMDSISNNLELFENQYAFEEFDINTVAYRLMEAERYSEAQILFGFNVNRYPNSWNVYDSMGELQLNQGNWENAKRLYQKSLKLNPNNLSGIKALETLANHLKTK